MLERLLLTVILATAGVALYLAVRGRHQVLASRVTAAGDRPAVLYFCTASCAPCVAQGRYLEQVQQDLAGRVAVEKIDAEVEAERASQFGIFTVPTTLVVDRAGQVRHINYGLADARKLAHQIEDAAA